MTARVTYCTSGELQTLVLFCVLPNKFSSKRETACSRRTSRLQVFPHAANTHVMAKIII